MSRTLATALDCCARGWRVLPLWPVVLPSNAPAWECSCRAGAACAHPGKHPACAGGVSSATTDAGRVERYWRAWAASHGVEPGVAVATGAGLVVVDLDARHFGDETWSRLLEGRPRVDTVESITGGGRHLWFSSSARVASSVGRLGAGVDVRGEGGYVVAPGTRHASGRLYTWEASSDPREGAALALLPAWLAALCVTPAPGEGGRVAALREGLEPGSVGAGERNATMARVACSLRARGVELAELLEVLRKVNATACAEPLGGRELDRIARGVCRRYGPGWSPAVAATVEAGERAYDRASARGGDYPWKADPGAIVAGMTSAVPADPGGADV